MEWIIEKWQPIHMKIWNDKIISKFISQSKKHNKYINLKFVIFSFMFCPKKISYIISLTIQKSLAT